LLREQGHGAKRSVVCGFCFSEWPSPRLECLHCGEATFESLPVFRSDDVDSVRIDACESCKTYIKTIDLTRDGEASPVVDDIASMTLDIWAREHGYRRLRANLFGF
jgi:FdhE protein